MTLQRPHPFGLSIERSAEQTVVHVAGEIDMETAPALKEGLLELADEGVERVVVDMAQTEFIDSTGLHALVVAVRQLRELGGDLVVKSPSPNAARVLELSGLTAVVQIT